MATKKVEKKEKKKTAPDVKELLVRTPSEGTVTIAMQKGVTLNVGQYEFVRLDASVIRNVVDDDEVILDELAHLGDLLDAALDVEMDKIE